MADTKIVISAEDRTRAAFAAIDRSLDKTTASMLKMQTTALKLAGAATLLVWFKQGAQGSEKWRDEMARLDRVTKEFFQLVGQSGALDPAIWAMKQATITAMGLTIAFGKLLDLMVAMNIATGAVMTGNFSDAKKVLGEWSDSVDAADEKFKKLNEKLFAEAPRGFAQGQTDDDSAAKEAARKRQKAEEDRLKETLDREKRNSKERLDAFEQEMRERAAMAELYNKEIEEQEKAQAEGEQGYELEKLRATRRLEAIQEGLLSERELENLHNQERQFDLLEALKFDLTTKEQYYTLEEETELRHQARMGDAVAQGVLARRAFEEMNSKQKAQKIFGDMISMTAGVAAHNKTMFQINKIATVSEIALGIPKAVQKAYDAYPPPFSFVMGGLQLAASLANLQQASSASFGGSTSAPSVAGGSAIPTYNTQTQALPNLSSQDQTTSTAVSVYISGNVVGNQAFIDDVLIPGIRDAIDNRDFTIIGSNSRQYLNLRT